MEQTTQSARPARQRGQTVLWFLATVAACCCIFALVYNVGQVANEKEKTVNAADAAALSGAMVEARMLNFEAYTNRAMIANEVTVAQLVSLDSWVQYDNELLYWIATYTSIVPYLNDVTQAISDVSQEVATGVNEFVQVAVYGVEVANTALYIGREYAHYATAFAAIDIAGQIAKANTTTFGGRYDAQPETIGTFTATVEFVNAINKKNWISFTDGYTDNNRGDAKGVILNSRDPFSTYRKTGWLIDAFNTGLEAAGLLATAGTDYIGFTKTSGSTTLQDYDHWAAQDSLDLTNTHIKFCYVVIPCGYETDVVPFGPPLGYGRVDADADGSTGKNMCDQTTTNCSLAVENAINISWSGPFVTSNGIPNIRDLAKDLSKTDPCTTSNGSDSPSLTYTAAVQKDGQATQTTQRLGLNTVDVSGPQGSPKMSDNLQNGDKMTSLAAACTFFLRPDLNAKDRTQASLARSDGVHEFASLYNPYWQARLSAPTDTWKATLLALIGSNPLMAPLTP